MTETGFLIAALAAGLVLGLLYFGSLWFVVRRLPEVRHPGVLLFASAVVRMTLLLAAFFLVMGDRPERLAVCLGGFLAARVLLTRRARPAVAAMSRRRPLAGKPS